MTGTTRVTIRDVARKAGVSVTTVSHALNGKGQIRPETRERIRKVASSLGYRPSRAAQALRRSRTGTIALILPSSGSRAEEREMISLDYYMAIASACAQGAFSHGYSLVLPPRLTTADEWRVLAPDGVVLCDPAMNDERIDLLEELGVPVVSIERDSGRPERPYYVAGDNVGNMNDVLTHLHGVGARRSALLWAESSWSWTLDSRDAYERWCAAKGHDPIVAPVSLNQLESDSYRASSALLESERPPDAVIASAERYAEGLLHACRERGLRVPDDLMVVSGIDNHLLQQHDPSITAIDLDPSAQALAAVAMLHDRLEGVEVTEPRIVPSKLRIRRSTQPG
ncbi:LacI family DNA-binding transcriptional regulator [Solicola gregarius]|uniref:LacI family transcriptional regulator n=1 Tax=Solicola gregarius TaxID=2908642 RepID=A0AA46TDU4_9ACTN|nr:LacI family DNA-binding transcriptional regulator [Solicola gregarius]UYM03487.1 LacI family transcriptional regulator [Solicola gregarius]